MEARDNLEDSHLVLRFQLEFGNALVVFKTTSIESVRFQFFHWIPTFVLCP